MTESGTRAVIYAAKSTEDKRGSIDTQLADCHQLAEREGWNVVDEFKDEGFSAYRGNRGPGLAGAKDALAKHAPCVLVVQHTDRLARGAGDEPGAADHLMELFFSLGRQGVDLWAVQSGKVDRIRALLEGERNTEDSKRKSQSVRDGLKRRRERGSPVGPVPLGYTVEKRVVDDDVLTQRVIDTTTRPTVERIFELIGVGHSSGAVARMLNHEGRRTKRGKTWAARQVRLLARNDVYAGRRGYPQIIDPGRWQAVNDGLARMDPAAVQRRKGGRPSEADDYLLKGVAFCARCGHSLYTRRHASGRHYVCGAVRECRGTCDAPAIPAKFAEAQVLNHLTSFTDNVESWLREQADLLNSGHKERAADLDRRRVELADFERKRERAHRRWGDEEDDDFARHALEGLQRIEAECTACEQQIAKAEALISEWATPDLDAGLDFYNRLRDLVEGQVRQARGARELNSALHQVLEAIWFDLEPDRDRLLAEFELRGFRPTYVLPDGKEVMFDDRRPTLPPMSTRQAALVEPHGLARALAEYDPTEANARWDALMARPVSPEAVDKFLSELDSSPSYRSSRCGRRSRRRSGPRP